MFEVCVGVRIYSRGGYELRVSVEVRNMIEHHVLFSQLVKHVPVFERGDIRERFVFESDCLERE